MAARKKKKKQGGKRKEKQAHTQQLSLADVHKWEIPPVSGNAVEINSLPSPIWTETKAQLIAHYLRLFLMITRHGAYIDGFAGPQDRANPASWAAKLVVEMTPRWMNRFFLCELDAQSFSDLGLMLQAQPKIRGRKILLKEGDFNQWVDEVLGSGSITDKTASFALLDQRSTECHWATVEKLASHKRGSKKIELFYFFPTGWVHRSISETKDTTRLDAWWGDQGWRQVEGIRQDQAVGLFLRKIQALGYRDVKSWPICEREKATGRTMYHMIHATDHLEAPRLMYRAYKNLIGGASLGQQEDFGFPLPEPGKGSK